MENSEDRVILRRTGAILILLGIVEFIMGMVTAPKGTFNFQFFGILIGSAIAFGNMRVVSVVRWLACLGLLSGALIILGEILVLPASLHAAQWRFVPGAAAMHYGGQLLVLAVTFFIFRQLGRQPLLAARAAAGRKQRDMRIPLVLGGLLGLAAAGFNVKMLNGEYATKARQEVAAQVGAGFEYFTTGVNVQRTPAKTIVFARVQAWNDRELREYPVQWEE